MRLLGKKSQVSFDPFSNAWHGQNFELLDIEFDAQFDINKIDLNSSGLWRYKNFLPSTCSNSIISLGEGFTPFIKKITNEGVEVIIKLDHLNPSGSYKDRGASVLISHLKSIGIQQIVQDSSGNAGASVAAYAAAAKINCKIFLPQATPESKINQMKAYGAEIIVIKGSREETAAVAFEEAKSSYYASHCFNPFFFQGTKTFVYEAYEQMNYQVPDYIVLPAGNGTLIIGAFLGYQDLQKAGLISIIPPIIAVQTAACNPLESAFLSNSNQIKPITKKESIAEGIAIANPIRSEEILDCIFKTNGRVISVNEDEILEAWIETSSAGHFIETTSAATIAGLNKFLQGIESGKKVLSLYSGHGLKSIDKIYRMSSKKNQ
ncbi:MAG: threonine synthase [Bacteroidia bacterium]